MEGLRTGGEYMKIIKEYYWTIDGEKPTNIVREISYEGRRDLRVSISEKPCYGDYKAKKIYQVNWSAMGAQSVEETELYINLMLAAVEIAKEQNL